MQIGWCFPVAIPPRVTDRGRKRCQVSPGPSIYAGARSLLVTHWPVFSNAAVRLTTRTFDNLQSAPDIGRAEALRRSMLALLEDRSDPINAYPAVWAPFTQVGDGAR